MSSGFGAGVAPKAGVVRYDASALAHLALYTQNGTGDTTVVAEDATYGSIIRTTVTNTDDQAGHVYLSIAPFTPILNTKGSFAAHVKFNHASAEFGIGLSDGFSTADTGIFSDTAATMTSQDSILIYQFSSSAFWRGEQRNATVATASGATTTAATAGTWYFVRCDYEVHTDGLHARFFVNGTEIYTIGHGGAVTPPTVASWDGLVFGWAVKTSTTTEVISYVKPMLLEYSVLGN